MRLLRPVLALSILALFASAPIASAVTLNEFRADQPGTDVDEYIELAGTPGEPLTDLSFIVIGDATAAGSGGGVEAIIPLTGYAIQPDGFFLIAEATFSLAGAVDLVTDLNLENADNVTYLIVSDLNPVINIGAGFGGSDLDDDDDGVVDATGDYDGDAMDDGPPWTAVVDCLGLVETPGTGDLIYCATQIGPAGILVPFSGYLCGDTDTWAIGSFDPTMAAGETPDGPNPECNVPVETSTWGSIKIRYN